jgi:hypothetical protein
VADPKDNLRPAPPWQPGQSGNPNGYSRKRRFSDALERLIEEEGADEFLRVGWKAAQAGDFNFWKYLYERHEGKIPDAEQDPSLELKEFARKLKERLDKKK